MVAARLGCEKVMVGTGWVNSCPDCIDRLTKHYSLLIVVAKKAAWAVNGCMTTESADYPMSAG